MSFRSFYTSDNAHLTSPTASYREPLSDSSFTSFPPSISSSNCSEDSFQTAYQGTFSPQLEDTFVNHFGFYDEVDSDENTFATPSVSSDGSFKAADPGHGMVTMDLNVGNTSEEAHIGNTGEDAHMDQTLDVSETDDDSDDEYMPSNDEHEMMMTDATNVRLTRLEANIGAILAAIKSLTAQVEAQNNAATRVNQEAPCSRRERPSDPPSGPRRRSSDHIALMRRIRAELTRLLGNDFMEMQNLPSKDELDAFASMWNSSIEENFFFRHMKSLQAAFRRKNADDADRRTETTAKRRWQRKQNLYHKRLGIAQEHPLLQPHVAMLQRLGIGGMSSDESDYEDEVEHGAVPSSGPAPRYIVHQPAWRAASLSFWLQTIDSVQIILRKITGRHRGAFPRLRVASEIESSSRSFVPDLPINAYNPVWLASRPFFQFEVRPTDETYSFNHDNRLFTYFSI
ncbi:hypothetical protein JR316_0000064 [Psilocybe cubensis]|uniref:Uncharacterized protein n=2 Tax=Psilocybe cubensis TaxID=181762 RepID=A0ACB8HDP5_PSICU|nr:hypothetical protein JR316_0000064 [Psilocybe cubensis]KAH9486001.1 hypothetical protein JR316_0000064 [Psilocybe cubensis]